VHDINILNMNIIRIRFWMYGILGPITIVWGAYEFVAAKDHGSARLLFLIGIFLSFFAGAIYLFIRFLRRRKS